MASNTTTSPMTELLSRPGIGLAEVVDDGGPEGGPRGQQRVGEGVVVPDDEGDGDGLPEGTAHGQDHRRLDPGARPGHHRGPHHLPARRAQGPGRLAVLAWPRWRARCATAPRWWAGS